MQDVERKVFYILKILNDAQEALGARVISRHLKEYGLELGERAVRYHLKIMDERGLTQLVGRDGRLITEEGIRELRNTLVRDKVGFSVSRIELLAFHTNFDLERKRGRIPVEVSFFPRKDFKKALQVMKPAFNTGLCVSDLVAVAQDGELLGDLTIRSGKAALATVACDVFNGTLLRAGVPVDSKFGGILQIRGRQPLRFVEIIHYAGSSVDPSKIFIKAGMTSVTDAALKGDGKILASFREIPAPSRSIANEIIAKLNDAGLGGLLAIGTASEPVCGIPVELNRVGIILVGGLNPVAMAKEAGIEVEHDAMGTVIEYQKLVRFSEL
jgi:repressor of nif and glnA expression